jgi:hypothetical protein
MALLGTSDVGQLREILSGSAATQKSIADVGAEDSWMRAVRAAGRS